MLDLPPHASPIGWPSWHGIGRDQIRVALSSRSPDAIAKWMEALDLPRFGGRVVESIYSGVRMVLLCFTLGFSVPVFCITGTRSPVCRASGRSFRRDVKIRPHRKPLVPRSKGTPGLG